MYQRVHQNQMFSSQVVSCNYQEEWLLKRVKVNTLQMYIIDIRLLDDYRLNVGKVKIGPTILKEKTFPIRNPFSHITYCYIYETLATAIAMEQTLNTTNTYQQIQQLPTSHQPTLHQTKVLNWEECEEVPLMLHTCTIMISY